MPITAASLVATVSMEGATAAQEQLAQLGSSASQAQSRLNQMQAGEGEASTSLGGRFVGAVKDGVSGLLNFGSTIGWAYQGFKTLADGAIGVGHVLLDSNASLEQTRVAFTSLLGSSKAAGDYLQQLQQFAAATPFEFPQVTEAAQHFIAFGFAAKDVIPTLTDIGDAMAGLGQGGDAVNHVVEIFGQMHAAGKLNAQDMMQLTSMGIPAWQYLADAMHKSIPEVQKLTSNGLIPANVAIADLRDGMHKAFGGDMQKQSQTFVGLLSTFQDNIRMAWTAFTGPLFEAAKNGLVVLGNLVSSKAFQDFATNTGKQLAAVFGQIGQVMSSDIIPALRPLLPIFASIGETAQGAFKQISEIVGGAFQQHMKTAASITQELGNWFNTTLVPALHQAMPGFQSLANTIMTVVVPGLARLWAIGQDVVDRVFPPLLKVIEAVLPVVIRLAGIIAGGLSEALKFLMPYILQAAQAIGQFAGDVATRIAPILINFFHNISAGLIAFQQIWAQYWPMLAPILKGIWDIIVGVVKIAWALVSGIIKIGLDLLSGNWGQAWNDLKDMLKGVWDGIKTVLKGALEVVFGIITAVVGNIVGWLDAKWNQIRNTINIVWSYIQYIIQQKIQEVQRAIVTIFGPLVEWMNAKWNQLRYMAEYVWNYIQYIIQQKIQQAQAIVQSVINTIVGFFAGIWGRISGPLGDLWNNVTGWFNNLLGKAFSWGSNLIDGFIKGIRSMIGNAGQAASDVINSVTSFLGFHSPAKQGEGRYVVEWGQGMIEGFNQGVLRAIPQLQTTVNMAVTAGTAPMRPSAAVPAPFLAQSRQPAPQIIVQSPPIYIDGKLLTNNLLPHIASAIRYGTGVR